MPSKLYHIYVILLVFFFVNTSVEAQFVQRKFNQTNGLVSYNVRNTVTDEFGFLWICTQEGLSKFDGKSFINYQKTNASEKYQINFTDCRGLYLDSVQHLIWVQGSSFGINVISTITSEIVKRIPLNFLYPDTWITGFLPISNKILLTTINGLFEYDQELNKITEISINGITKQRVNAIAISKNQLWVCVDDEGVFCLNLENYTLLKSFSLSQLHSKTSLIKFNSIQLYEDKIFIATNNSCIVLNNTQFSKLGYYAKEILNQTITSIFIHNKTLFLGGNSLYYFENDSIKKLADDTENWLKEINSISSLNKNLLAIGTVKGLVIYNINAPFITAIQTNKSTPFLNHIYSLEANEDASILLSCEKGIFNYNKNLKQYNKINANSNAVILNLGNKEFVFAKPNLLTWYNGKVQLKLSKKYPEFAKYNNYFIVKVVALTQNKFALCTDNSLGILIWDKTNHNIEEITTNHPTFKLNTNIVNSCSVDSNGNLWILADYSFSVINFAKNTIVHFDFPFQLNTKVGLYYDMLESNNKYWLSAYGTGVLVLNKKFEIVKTINTQAGLCNNGTYNLFAANNKIFVSTNNGIASIDNSNYAVRNYTNLSDGLHDDAFEEAVGCKQNNSLIFGGINGFSILNPNNIKINGSKPSLYFTEVKISTNEDNIDRINVVSNTLNVPNNYKQVGINFSSINFTNAQQIKYWYKINELKTGWIALDNQSFVNLIGISPGKYILQIKCTNEDGGESDVKQLLLTFHPKWYQTILFKIAVLFAMITILFILYKYRINQLTNLLNMRQKISQDLHDDVGSSLSSIKMYSQVVQLQNTDNILIQNIENNTTDVLQKLDDIVWATNPKNDNLQNIIDRLELFAKPLCKTANIQFLMQVPVNNEAIFVNELSRHSLYMIIKEAINNAVKYAQCNTIHFTLAIHNKNIMAAVTDDGKGFDTAIATTRNGLINMQIRATNAKGKFTLNSIPNQGTIVAVTLPKK